MGAREIANAVENEVGDVDKETIQEQVLMVLEETDANEKEVLEFFLQLYQTRKELYDDISESLGIVAQDIPEEYQLGRQTDTPTKYFLFFPFQRLLMSEDSHPEIEEALNYLENNHSDLFEKTTDLEVEEDDENYVNYALILTGEEPPLLVYNPDFVEEETTERIAGVIAHVAMEYKNNEIPPSDSMQYPTIASAASSLFIDYELAHVHDIDLIEGDGDHPLIPDETGTWTAPREGGGTVELENIDEKSYQEVYEGLVDMYDELVFKAPWE